LPPPSSFSSTTFVLGEGGEEEGLSRPGAPHIETRIIPKQSSSSSAAAAPAAPDDDRCLLRSDTEPVGFFAVVVPLEAPPTRLSDTRNPRPHFVAAERGSFLGSNKTRRVEGNGWPPEAGAEGGREGRRNERLKMGVGFGCGSRWNSLAGLRNEEAVVSDEDSMSSH
jgi:hypothetical protein